MRGAFLEVLADALGSLAVLVSAGDHPATGWQPADPIASLVIGLMIVPRTVKLLRETLDVLLEAAPKDVDMAEVRAHILALPGVDGRARSARLDDHLRHAGALRARGGQLQTMLDAVGHEKMLHELQDCLGDHFDVEHCTFQLEPGGHAEHEAKLCH